MQVRPSCSEKYWTELLGVGEEGGGWVWRNAADQDCGGTRHPWYSATFPSRRVAAYTLPRGPGTCLRLGQFWHPRHFRDIHIRSLCKVDGFFWLTAAVCACSQIVSAQSRCTLSLHRQTLQLVRLSSMRNVQGGATWPRDARGRARRRGCGVNTLMFQINPTCENGVCSVRVNASNHMNASVP